MERKTSKNLRFREKSTISRLGGTCLTAAFSQAANELHGLPIYDGNQLLREMSPNGKGESNLQNLFRVVKRQNRFRLDTQTDLKYADTEGEPVLMIKGELESGNKVIFSVNNNSWKENLISEKLVEKRSIFQEFQDWIKSSHSVLASGLEEEEDGDTRIRVHDINFENVLSISDECLKESIASSLVAIVSKI